MGPLDDTLPALAPVAGNTEPAFVAVAGDPRSGLLFVCDHASNYVPVEYGDLGLDASQLSRHIAFDPGAAALTTDLARRLGAPAVLSTFSRLLIDPNRGEDDPTLVMRLSDGAIVPGNRYVDEAERDRRISRWYRPYHAAIEAAIGAARAAGAVPVLVSMHSFTPVWRGSRRPWHAGILWDSDPRLALPLIQSLAADPALVVGDNEPYAGALRNDCMYEHATRRGLAHALIEIRQDLIADPPGIAAWVDRLAPILDHLNRLPGMHQVRHFGSLSGPVDPI